MAFEQTRRAALRGIQALGMLLATACIMLAASGASAASPPSCTGKFLNPITDICWSCLFPLRIGGLQAMTNNQEDIRPAEGSPFCNCGLRVGLTVEFWEPARIFEAVRKPHCYVSLGGVQIDPGIDAPEASLEKPDQAKGQSRFYQAHWYINPALFWLEVLIDNPCLEQGGFDLAYATEYDPLWDDDMLSFFLAPESALFGNVLAQAACAADCVAATAGFSNNLLFWCGGCQGSMYPLTGWVAAAYGGIQTSSLLMARMTNKLHRQGRMWAGSGRAGLCSFYPQPLMDKTNYKSQMLYPIANTAKIAGRCCQPYGRSTILWGAGKEFPYKGEDFSYQIFRKRACCAGSTNWNLAYPAP